MATSELELYYERKMRLVLDALDELDRLELDPKTAAAEIDTIRELRPPLQREFALVDAQFAGVTAGQSALPLPPEAMRKRIAKLCDEVEAQVNANKATNATIGAAGKFLDLVAKVGGELPTLP